MIADRIGKKFIRSQHKHNLYSSSQASNSLPAVRSDVPLG
jgi:hypothetical protein